MSAFSPLAQYGTRFRGLLAEEEPGGVLGDYGNPGGLLSGGWVGRMRNRQPGERPFLDALGRNAQSLWQAGTSVLMAPTRRMAAQAWTQGLANGSQADVYRAQQRAAREKEAREEALRQRREEAVAETMQWLVSQGKLPAGMESLAAAYPEAVAGFALDAMKPADPPNLQFLTGPNGEILTGNPRSGQVTPAYSPPGGIQPKPTDDVREFEYARQNGFEGSFADWMRIRQPVTNIDARNMGNIPPGHTVEYDEQGRPVRMVPIPGSPAAREAAAEEQAAATRQSARQQSADIVVQDIDRVLSTLEGPNQATAPAAFITGPLGSALSRVPGTPAADVARTLDTIKANVGFDRLQQMRDSSPTGGALGQVSQQENLLLQSVLGSLAQSQTYAQFQYNLKRLKNVYLDIVHGPGQGPPREQLDGAPEQANGDVPQIASDAEYEALPPGTEFIDPEGRRRRKP